MNFWIKLLKILQKTVKKPAPFGLFHIITALSIAATCFFVCKRFKTPDEKTVRKIILTVSIITLILEIYKQIVYSFVIIGEGVAFRYEWHVFPWQFCSTPLYAGLIAALVKNKKVHKAMICYLSSYALFAGLAVMVAPYGVFSDFLGVNIQTVFCHGSMIVLGVFLLQSGYVRFNKKAFLSAFLVFITGVIIAIVMNETAYLIGIPDGQVFDMYFLSRHTSSNLVIYDFFKDNLPSLLFYAVYIIIFSLAALIMVWIFSKRNKKSINAEPSAE